jgi:hypothetical protein
VSVRPTSQRIQNTRDTLRSEVDLWVASASKSGDAYLIPLSFTWDGSHVIIATPRRSITARNLLRAGWARLALGPTRDVVIVEGLVDEVDVTKQPALADAHAARVGFEARDEPDPYVYLRVTPRRIQAWRNPAELPDRDVMRDGVWLE